MTPFASEPGAPGSALLEVEWPEPCSGQDVLYPLIEGIGDEPLPQIEQRSDRRVVVEIESPRVAVQVMVALFREARAGKVGSPTIGGVLRTDGRSTSDTLDQATALRSLAARRQCFCSRHLFDAARVAEPRGSPVVLADPDVRWHHHGTFRIDALPIPTELCELGLDGFSPLSLPDNLLSRRVPGDDVLAGWWPACRAPVHADDAWILDQRTSSNSLGETWSALDRRKQKRLEITFLLSTRAAGAVEWRGLWLRQLRRAAGKGLRAQRLKAFDLRSTPPYTAYRPTSARPLDSCFGLLLEAGYSWRIEIVTQVAETLAGAHRAGIVHGALCPETILIKQRSRGGLRIRLTGFAMPRPDESPYRAIYGLPSLDEPQAVGVSTDLRAFGIFFYQMIVGDLRRSLPSDWQADVDDPILRDCLSSTLACFVRSRYRSLAHVADVLRWEWRVAGIKPQQSSMNRHETRKMKKPALLAGFFR